MIRNPILIALLFAINTTTVYAQNASNIIVLDSEELRTTYHTWSVVSVERRPDCTIVEKCVVPIDGGETWIASSRDEFIEDALSGRRYFIQSSEIGFEQKRVVLGEFKDRVFKEVYPKLPADVKYINISSGSKYFVKALDLSLSISPVRPPVSKINLWGINLGDEYKYAVSELKKMGYKPFYKEQTEGIWAGEDINTYFSGKVADYNITLKLTGSVQHGVVTDIEVLYHNHVDKYEMEEHLQELVDEVKASFPYRFFEEKTPDYRSATSMLEMKSGNDKIFKNVTVVIFRGYYSIGDSPVDKKEETLGSISFEVHSDNMHNDFVIAVRYSDRKIDRYIRRSGGKYRW